LQKTWADTTASAFSLRLDSIRELDPITDSTLTTAITRRVASSECERTVKADDLE
jgi:hypothetical protein